MAEERYCIVMRHCSLRDARVTPPPGGGEAPREGGSLNGRVAWFELRRWAWFEHMRCFGPSASQRARLRRDELEEAFGEGYDEAEESRIFALEELARQQSELEEAFGEGYDPEEEARLFAEDDASPPAASRREAPGDHVRGNSETSRRQKYAREDAVAASPRARPKAPSEEKGKRAPAPTTTPPRAARSDASPAPRRAVACVAAKTSANANADSSASLPPLDLGDPEKYRRLRETLGVESALRAPLRQLLAPLEADANARGGEKANPDLFVPPEMPRGLLLPFAPREAYERLELRETRQADGSVGYGTLATEGAGSRR